MTDVSPFQRALRDQLLAAAHRPPPRRRWPWAAGAVGSAVAALVAALSFLGASPAAADVKVTIEGGRVEVLVTDLTATPADVAKAIQEAGLDARVVSHPVGPSNVGRFIGVSLSDGTRPITRIGEGVSSFMGFSLREGWPGTLVIQLGRTARAGEAYGVSSDAFADREPLDCSGILGGTLVDAVPHLGRVRVRVEPLDSGTLVFPIELTPEVATKYGAWYITRGLAGSPRDVLLQLQPAAPQPALAEPPCS